MKKTLQSITISRFLSAAALSLSLLLAGCQGNVSETVGDLLTNPFGSSDEEEEVINVVALTPQEVPWHIQATVAATVLRLKDEDPDAIDEKFSLVGSGGIATDENSSLAGFGVENVQINDFFRPQEAPEINRLGARLILVDPTGRRLGVSFVADYELAEDQVILKGHQWGYSRAETPAVETYIVRTAAIEELDEASVRDYQTFRSHILSNAAPTGDPTASADIADYTVVTFVMDRILDGDKFEVRLSAVKDGTEGFPDASRYILHDNGWVTGIVPGRFSLAGEKSFWVKAVYTPKEEEDGGFFGKLLTNERLIGLYNTANLSESAS
ncbi:hypothetical protein [Sneathiella litorea]|uniref:Uncharacterized protein n=1 Tax=Sneathiella litorea TaxID=2606216 RepID=A0A6L8WAI6_9PROT|nr:hypothetical protein [Sneathiella litorea]MZR32081.1 hypothetical protein [Sneathiella litorea]